VLLRVVVRGSVLEQQHSNESHDAATKDVQADRVWILRRKWRTKVQGPQAVLARPEPRRDQWRRSTRDDGRQLIAKRGSAVAQASGKALRDQRCLRSVLHVVRNEGKRDDDEHDNGYRRRIEAEVDESP